MFPSIVEMMALGAVFWAVGLAVLIGLCFLNDYEQPIWSLVVIVVFLGIGQWWTSGGEHASLWGLAPKGADLFWFFVYYVGIGLTYGVAKVYLNLKARKNEIIREMNDWSRRGQDPAKNKKAFLTHLNKKGLVTNRIFQLHMDGTYPQLDVSPDGPQLARKFATWSLYWFASILVTFLKDLSVWLFHASIDYIRKLADRMYGDLNRQLSLTEAERNPKKAAPAGSHAFENAGSEPNDPFDRNN